MKTPAAKKLKEEKKLADVDLTKQPTASVIKKTKRTLKASVSWAEVEAHVETFAVAAGSVMHKTPSHEEAKESLRRHHERERE